MLPQRGGEPLPELPGTDHEIQSHDQGNREQALFLEFEYRLNMPDALQDPYFNWMKPAPKSEE